jgi:hypothetical protein
MPPEDVDEDDTDVPDAEEGPVLDPDELDFSRDRRVAAIDEDRYVVSATDERPVVPDDVPSAGSADPGAGAEGTPVAVEAARERLAAELDATEREYGFEAVAQFEGETRHGRVASDDVIDAFDELLSWYADGVADEMSTRDVLGILFAESDLDVRVPAQAVRAAVTAHGLSPDDDVAELLDAVRRAEGLELTGKNHD